MGIMLHIALCNNLSQCVFYLGIHATRGCCCTTFDMQAFANEEDLLYVMHTTSQ